MFMAKNCFKAPVKTIHYFMLNLCDAKKNKTYVIVDYQNLSTKILRRLCDLGLTRGQTVVVASRSLLKKALLVEVRGYLLSLKADIAKGVKVK